MTSAADTSFTGGPRKCCSLMSPGKGEELLAVLMHAQGRWTSVIYADMCCLGLGAQLMQHDGIKDG